MIWNIRKKKHPISTARRKKESKNLRIGRGLRDTFKHSNIHIIGVPEGEEKEQEIGNLFEKNNERKLP